MAYRNLLLLLLTFFALFVINAHAGSLRTNDDQQFLNADSVRNYVKNSGAEKNVANITDADSIVSQDSADTPIIMGDFQFEVDADASGEKACWDLDTLQGEIEGNAMGSLMFRGDASDYKAYVYNDTESGLASNEVELTNSTQTQIVDGSNGLSFIADPANTYELCIESTDAAAAAFVVDNLSVGRNTGIGSVEADILSAQINIDDSIEREKGNWLDSCTWDGSGTVTCNVKSGTFNQLPNCTATGLGSRDTISYVEASSSTTTLKFLNRNTTTDAAGDTSINVMCQKTGADSQQVQKVGLTDLSGSSKSAATSDCKWVSSSGTMASYSADSDCPVPSVTGNLYAPATKIPATIARTLLPGSYKVTAQSIFYMEESTSGNAVCGYEIYDGTNSGGIAGMTQTVNDGRDSSFLIEGHFKYDTTQTDVQFEIRSKLISGNGTCEVAANVADLTFTLVPLSQNVPAPLVKNAVTTSSEGVERIERVSINSCTTSPCTIESQSGYWVTSFTRSGTGNYTINIAAGVFSSTPACVCSGYRTSSLGALCLVDPQSATRVDIETSRVDSGSLADNTSDLSVICMGPN